MNALLRILPALLALAPCLRAQSPTFVALEFKLDQAVDQLLEGVLVGPMPVERVAAVREMLIRRNDVEAELYPQTCHLRARLELAMEELIDRARRAQLRAEDIEHFVEEAVEERLDAEIQALEALLLDGPIAPARYAYMRSLIVRRAQITVDRVQAGNVRARLLAALDELVAAAAAHVASAQQVQELRRILAEDRIERLLRFVQGQVAAGRASRAQYVLLEGRLLERAKIASGSPFDPCE